MTWTKNSKFSKKRGHGKRSRKSGRKTNKLSKGMRKAVASVVRAEEETKCCQYTTNCSIGSYGSTSQSNGFIPLIPYSSYAAISQGGSQAQRIGNKLRIVKATFSYILYPAGYNATTNVLPCPQEVIIRLMSVKNTNTLVSSAGSYFQYGNGVNSPVGNIVDIPGIVNTDLYTQYKMVRHKLGFAAWVPTPGLVASQGYYTNNDFAMNVVKTIDYTKYCPKIIRFNDNTSTPINRVLQTFIEAVNSDGSTSATNQAPVNLCYTISIWYKDA